MFRPLPPRRRAAGVGPESFDLHDRLGGVRVEAAALAIGRKVETVDDGLADEHFVAEHMHGE